MTVGSLTPLQQATPLRECFFIDDVCTLVANQLGVDPEFVTSETHFTNDLGADLLDRVELMLAIEAKFAGVEITDDDVEQIQVVGEIAWRQREGTLWQWPGNCRARDCRTPSLDVTSQSSMSGAS
jgi:acyl carrier protein